MADRETRLVIQAALDQLPEDQRRPMVLIDIEGYSVAETARMLGIAEGTVKSRCARGRAKLAKILGQQRNPDADTDVPTHESERPAKAAVRSTEASPNTDSPSES
jgi:RNA polymerase sigma-70 factor (ECF subfamily)